MKNKKYEILVGLVTLIGLTLLFLSIIWGKNLSNMVEYRPITISFMDINSLTEGDKIFVKGVQVGEITSIELTNNHVLVKGKVDTALKIHSDASALIVNKELMGGRIVILDIGSSDQPLSEQDVITGKESTGITEMLAKAGGAVSDLGELIKNSDSVMLRLNRILPQKKLDVTIGELSDEVKDLSGSVQKNVSSLTVDLGKIFQKIDTVMDTIAIAANDGKSGLRDFKEIMPQIKKSLPKLDSLLVESNRVMSALKKEESSLGKLIYDKKMYNELNTTILRLDSLILQIKKDGFKANIDLW